LFEEKMRNAWPKGGNMLHQQRRLQKLESRKREQILCVLPSSDARRILLQRLERMSRSLQVERDLGVLMEPGPTFDEVQEMLHKHLKESRIRREENEKRIAEHRFLSRYNSSRQWT
jgi:hypothetical protein